MANKLIPWQRYLSDVAHKYVGYPDDEESEEDTMIINVDTETGACDKTYNEILEASKTQNVVFVVNLDDAVLVYYFVAINNQGGYFIYVLGVDLSKEVPQPTIVSIAASTADSYPVFSM